VIRGEDHISNTPKQILMQRALGFREPVYAHIPLILNPDRSKMSKRFSDTAVLQYRDKGYLPDALINFLALLGWHPKDDREVLTTKDLIKEFSLARVQSAGAVFNEEKLNWLNREHMKLMSDKDLVRLLMPKLGAEHLAADESFLEKLVAVERGRANTLDELLDHAKFFFALPDYEPALLVWKEGTPAGTKAVLETTCAGLEKLSPQGFSEQGTLADTVASIIGEQNRGAVLWPLRVALSGQKASPDPKEIMGVLGKEESLRRIAAAIKKLGV